MKPEPSPNACSKVKRCCRSISTSGGTILAPYERMLFDTWGNQISETLCLLPLMSGDTMLGVLKLAQCEEKVFTTTNLNLLRQIAERVESLLITPSPIRKSIV
ncbi:GAF domain-containing protein [Escherichia coli]